MGVELDESKAERFEGARALGLFWQLTPNVVATRVSGHVEGSALAFYTQRVERILARGDRLRVFHDWRGISTFDSEVRAPYREWATSKDGLIEPTFLVQSRVLSMALSVTALVIKRDLVVLSDAAEYSRRLRVAVSPRSLLPPRR